MTKRDEDGVILVQVLGLIAFASAVAFIMISLQDIAIVESQRYGDDAQALALAYGGEASVIAAFRRDGVEAPQIDHFGETWAGVAQQQVEIEDGTFGLDLEDAQAKYNINRMASAGLSDIASFRRIAEAAGLQLSDIESIELGLKTVGPINSLRTLSTFGLSDGVIESLLPWCAALPEQRTHVNLNTADEALIRIFFNDPANAARFIALRKRDGYVFAEALTELNIILPPGTGLTTNYLITKTRVTHGRGRIDLHSVLVRHRNDGGVDVSPIARTIF